MCKWICLNFVSRLPLADEIRNLAMMAAKAVKKTSGLVEASIKSVNNGSVLLSKIFIPAKKVLIQNELFFY